MNIQSVETHYSFDARDNKKKVNKNTKFSLFLFFVNVDQDARKKLKSGTRNPTVKLEKEEKKNTFDRRCWLCPFFFYLATFLLKNPPCYKKK
jgi:hypothetical protein